MNIRNWSWELHTVSDIRGLVESITSPLFVIDCTVSQYHDSTQFITDNELFARVFAKRYGVNHYHLLKAISEVGTSSINLIYLTNSLSESNSLIRTPNQQLMNTYERTDVAYCPRTNTALIRGPEKFGFVKSLILGLLSFWTAQNSIYGAHCGLVNVKSGGIAFIGRHGSGKSTLSLITTLCSKKAQFVTDDWALWHIDDSQGCRISCECADSSLFVDADTVEAVIKSIPKYHAPDIGDGLIKKLHEITKTEKTIERIDISLSTYLPSEMLGSTSYINHLFLLTRTSDIGNNPIMSSEDAFIDFIIDTSYYIPFHSYSSRHNLSRNVERGNISEELEMVESRLLSERLFWKQVYPLLQVHILDTNKQGIWQNYLAVESKVN